jgi:uncharacterized protein (TIGR02246 family)
MLRAHLEVILALVVLVSISAAPSRAEEKSRTADEAEIKKLVASWTDCFNRKDAHGCAMLYTADGELTTVRGDVAHGPEDVERHNHLIFSTFLKNAHRTDTVRSVRFLSPTIASVDSEWRMIGATAPNAKEAAKPVRIGLLTWIVTKHNGQWYITLFHEFDYPGY